MKMQENIDKMIEEALNSVDDAQRAAPRPFCLPVSMHGMARGTESVWEKAGRFIARPSIAFTGLCLIVLLNVMVVMFNKKSDTATVAEQTVQTQSDEFSYTAITIYDNDNTP
ncbi:MAG: hypothetical protein IPL54_15200 [Chitinophagaceae bacterium]|nr:hypothetical protein [Chitinophagaceae bacterium]